MITMLDDDQLKIETKFGPLTTRAPDQKFKMTGGREYEHQMLQKQYVSDYEAQLNKFRHAARFNFTTILLKSLGFSDLIAGLFMGNMFEKPPGFDLFGVALVFAGYGFEWLHFYRAKKKLMKAEDEEEVLEEELVYDR